MKKFRKGALTLIAGYGILGLVPGIVSCKEEVEMVRPIIAEDDDEDGGDKPPGYPEPPPRGN